MPAPIPQYRIAEIDVRRPSPGAIIECLRFDNDQRQGKGFTLFAFAEIHSSSYVYERLLDTVHAALSQVRTLVAGMDGDPMVRFEKIVQKVNEALASFAVAEATPVQWTRVNLFLFQLADEHLCFSGLGSLTNVFLQQQPAGDAKAFDLLGSLEQPEAVDPQKPLAAIVCGTMAVGDLLFVGTQNLQALRESIGIIPLCQAHPPVTAAYEIQEQLRLRKSLESYLAVVVAGVALTAPKSEPRPAAPQATPAAADPEMPAEDAEAPFVHAAELETASILEHGSAHGPSGLDRLLSKARETVSQGFSFNRGGDKRSPGLLSPISLAGLRGMNAGYTRSLFAEKRKTLLLAGAAAVVLVGGGLWIRHARQPQAEQRLWTAVYDQTVDAKNRAEAALVYGDEDRARAQFTQAQGTFRQLDEKTADRVQAKSGLQKELDEIRTRLRKETVVATPTVVADLGDGAFQGLVIENGVAYTIDTKNNQVRSIALKDGSPATTNAPDGLTLRLVGNGQSAPLLLADDRSLLTLKNGGLTAMSLPPQSKASSTTALTSYGRRVYALDATAGMIWRYNATASSLTSESAYLAQPSDDLKRGVSLAIDSSIYVATGDGGVHKFTSGQRDGWDLMPVDPPLRRISQIWTQADSGVLALADPQDKRVLLFNKNGRLVQQIVSPTFQGPSAVWGDQAAGALYVLDGSKLLKFDLPSA